jgi:GR25 family glycosyltransferase involved in LPS biosynthesis
MVDSIPPCLNYIDAIIYINLEYRNDRREHVLNEIKKIDPTLSKTHRIDAIHIPENGALGCSLSHIKALELCKTHPEWKYCLILEDDFTFVATDKSQTNYQIVELFATCTYFDMLLLAYGFDAFIYERTISPNVVRVHSSQTTSGYVVNQHYIDALIQNYRESSDLLRQKGRHHEGCLDQYWKRLMPYGEWYAYHTRIGYQYANFSDIENRFHNYEC